MSRRPPLALALSGVRWDTKQKRCRHRQGTGGRAERWALEQNTIDLRRRAVLFPYGRCPMRPICLSHAAAEPCAVLFQSSSLAIFTAPHQEAGLLALDPHAADRLLALVGLLQTAPQASDRGIAARRQTVPSVAVQWALVAGFE